MRAAPEIEPPVYVWQYSYSPSKTGQSAPRLKRSSCERQSDIFSGVMSLRKRMYSSEWKAFMSAFDASFGRKMFMCLYSP